MTSTVRRAGAFALVGTLALFAPLGPAVAAVPFAVVALLAAFVVDEGPLFDLFARPGDREEGRLNGLLAFALAATGVALFAAFGGMPVAVFVGAVLLLVYGNLVAQAVRTVSTDDAVSAAGFVVGGGVAGSVGLLVTPLLAGGAQPAIATVVFVAVSGSLLGAVLRSVLFELDDPLVLLSTALLLWLLYTLTDPGNATAVTPDRTQVAVALAVTAVLGYLSYALDTASVAGMLTGVFLSLLTIVLGGYGWFAVLTAFFAIGGLSTKFRYEEKLDRGVAEENEGARGSANVLANASVGLVAVLAFAAAPIEVGGLSMHRLVFLYAFVGSVATAMSDTLSSEIGGVFDRPRLITTLRPVEPGTDGGVTWQGEVAGVGGAALVAAIAAVLVADVGTTGGGVVVVAGVAGMTVDSLLGATVEGGRLGNGAVNFLATLSGALVAAALALALGLTALS